MNHSEINESPAKDHQYQVIAQDLREAIDSGVLTLGERLPSTSTLCTRYGVSTITIRAALKELVTQGYLVSRPRSGFFVSNRQNSSQRKGLIALLTESGRAAFFLDCIAGVENTIKGAGYHLIISNSYATQEFEAEHLKSLIEQVEGFIIMPVADGGNYALYLSLIERNIPFVFLDRYVEKLAVPAVTTDNELGGFLATSHLIECGCESIYGLLVKDSSSQRDRLRGYERALKTNNIALQANWVRRTKLANEAAGYELARQILTERKSAKQKSVKPIGLFCVNDAVARGTYLAIKEAGCRIPEDVAVVGFDDIDAVFYDPPLTSVRQNVYEMGALSAQKLLELLDGQENVASVRMKPELMIRNSTDTKSEFCLKNHIGADTTPARYSPTRLVAPAG